MGSVGSYLKVKAQQTVISFYYEHDGKYKLRTINGHASSLTNDEDIKSSDHYNKYHGEWWSYDGDSENLHKILSNFKPQCTLSGISNVGVLFEELKGKCDLEKYENIFTTVGKWVTDVLDVCLKIPQVIIGFVKLKALCWDSDDKDKDKDKISS